MMFGRKRNSEPVDDQAVASDDDGLTADEADVAADEAAAVPETDPEPEASEAEASDGAIGPAESRDPRADGPFDIDEVDLAADDVTRIDLGTLVVTPWQGLNLQLQVNEATRQVRSLTGVWQKSGIEVALFAAPASAGLADDFRDDAVEEAEGGGGTAELADGPFGTEVRRVVPQSGPNGEQLFHVSRIWFAEGPRWLLRGTLLGEAALEAGDGGKARPFVEFFRNLVVRRGTKPMVPGDLITMELPNRDEG